MTIDWCFSPNFANGLYSIMKGDIRYKNAVVTSIRNGWLLE